MQNVIKIGVSTQETMMLDRNARKPSGKIPEEH